MSESDYRGVNGLAELMSAWDFEYAIAISNVGNRIDAYLDTNNDGEPDFVYRDTNGDLMADESCEIDRRNKFKTTFKPTEKNKSLLSFSPFADTFGEAEERSLNQFSVSIIDHLETVGHE